MRSFFSRLFRARTPKSRRSTFRPKLERLEPRLALTAGDLDLSFGGDGLVEEEFNNNGGVAYDVLIRGGGRILAAGWSNNDFALAQFHPDGTLDTAFDVDGRVTWNLGGVDVFQSLARGPAGKFYAAGYSDDNFVVARFHGNGALDTTFGGVGYVLHDFGGLDQATAVIEDADGNVLVGGYKTTGSFVASLAMARFDSQGNPDPTFGIGGFLTTNLVGGFETIRDLKLMPDGRIVVAGQALPAGTLDFFVARFLPDGSPDPTFNGTGWTATDFGGSNEFALSLIVRPSGKVIVGGYDTNVGRVKLARYRSDGALDPTFGPNGDGKVSVLLGGSVFITDIAAANSRIVVVGMRDADFLVGRFLLDGTPDALFGQAGTGFVQTDFGTPDDVAYAVAIQPNDFKIVVAGTSNPPLHDNFALARYENGVPQVAPTGEDRGAEAVKTRSTVSDTKSTSDTKTATASASATATAPDTKSRAIVSPVSQAASSRKRKPSAAMHDDLATVSLSSTTLISKE